MEAENLLVKVAKILQNLNIPYLITSGIAVSVWGRLRATFDIDIVVELKPQKIKPLARALLSIGKNVYVDER